METMETIETIKKLFTPTTIYLKPKDIKIALGIKNNKKLRELLDSLTADKFLYCDLNSNRYYQAKTYELMTMVTACCNGFESTFTYADISEQCAGDDDTLKRIINILELDGMIYNYDYQRYCKIPSNFFISLIFHLFNGEEPLTIKLANKNQ